MPFYFSMYGTGQTPWCDLPDIDLAYREAIEDARQLMSNAILEGRDISSRYIEIGDQAGELLQTIPFRHSDQAFIFLFGYAVTAPGDFFQLRPINATLYVFDNSVGLDDGTLSHREI
jgi:hypothetical protein